MLITADQILCHLIGDYLLQSDWMATEKTKKLMAAIVHALLYTAAFIFLTRSWHALLLIAVSHFIIDHWRLARYACWIKNYIAPKWLAGSLRNQPWAECSATGYHRDRPLWMTVWLLIIADNTLHLICNGLALKFF